MEVEVEELVMWVELRVELVAEELEVDELVKVNMAVVETVGDGGAGDGGGVMINIGRWRAGDSQRCYS